MSSQTLTREQVEKLVKENPKFAEELAKAQKENDLNGDSANSVKTYYDLNTARAELGLLKLGKEGDVTTGKSIVTKGKPNLASGVIEDKRFLFTECNKSQFIISFKDEIFEGVDYGVIPNKNNVSEVYHINCDEKSSMLRINLLYVNGDSIEVVSHFEAKDCVCIGKEKLLYTTKLKKQAKEETDYAHQFVFFNIDCTNNTISVACDTNGDNSEEGYWIFVPSFVKASMLNNIDCEVTNKYTDNKTDIIAACGGVIPEGEGETTEKYKKLASFLESCLYGNPYVDKYTLVKTFEDKCIIPLKDLECFEENSGELDEMNVSGYLFPRFGFENVKPTRATDDANELGLPVLTEKDKANLKVIGISKEIVDDIINSSNATVETAKISINAAKANIEEKKVEIYDAKCKMSVDIDTDRWVETAYDCANVLVEEVAFNNEISNSEKFIKDTEMQLLGFINVSERIQGKIDRGEFSNAYLLTCVSTFWKMVLNRIGKEECEKQTTCILTSLLKVINYYYLQGDDKDDMVARKNEMFTNTLSNRTGVKDKYGNENRSVEATLSGFVNSLIRISDIPENISEEEFNDEVITRIAARYEFIKAIATSPLSIISKLYPEIQAACDGREVSESEKEFASKYRSEIGFENIDTDEYRVLVEAIVSAISESRVAIEKDNGVKLAVVAVKNANEFAKKIGSKSVKGRKNKLEAYIRSVVLLDNTKYLDPVASGLRLVAENEEVESSKIKYVFDDKVISVEEYESLIQDDKKNYSKCAIVDDKSKVRLITDLTIRTSLMSSFCTILYKLFNDYESAIKPNKDVNSDEMFVSTLSLIVPALQLLETVDLSKIEDPFDPISIIDGDKKVKLGTSAIKGSLGDIVDRSSLIAGRKEYVLQCLKFVETSFNS